MNNKNDEEGLIGALLLDIAALFPAVVGRLQVGGVVV